jgi:hypothetical protein
MDRQSRNPERVEVGIGQRKRQGRAVRQPPRAVSAPGRFGGQVSAHTPLAQFDEAPLSPLPLLSDRRPQPAPDPLLQVG